MCARHTNRTCCQDTTHETTNASHTTKVGKDALTSHLGHRHGAGTNATQQRSHLNKSGIALRPSPVGCLQWSLLRPSGVAKVEGTWLATRQEMAKIPGRATQPVLTLIRPNALHNDLCYSRPSPAPNSLGTDHPLHPTIWATDIASNTMCVICAAPIWFGDARGLCLGS